APNASGASDAPGMRHRLTAASARPDADAHPRTGFGPALRSLPVTARPLRAGAGQSSLAAFEPLGLAPPPANSERPRPASPTQPSVHEFPVVHHSGPAGGSGGSPPGASTAGGSWGSPPRASTAGGSWGSPPRASTGQTSHGRDSAGPQRA